jgi:hypothetical protein
MNKSYCAFLGAAVAFVASTGTGIPAHAKQCSTGIYPADQNCGGVCYMGCTSDPQNGNNSVIAANATWSSYSFGAGLSDIWMDPSSSSVGTYQFYVAIYCTNGAYTIGWSGNNPSAWYEACPAGAHATYGAQIEQVP